MLSSVLKSEKAVEVNILIIRAFVRMRELLYSDKELALRVEQIEKNLDFQGKTLEMVVKTVSKLLKATKIETKEKLDLILINSRREHREMIKEKGLNDSGLLIFDFGLKRKKH